MKLVNLHPQQPLHYVSYYHVYSTQMPWPNQTLAPSLTCVDLIPGTFPLYHGSSWLRCESEQPPQTERTWQNTKALVKALLRTLLLISMVCLFSLGLGLGYYRLLGLGCGRLLTQTSMLDWLPTFYSTGHSSFRRNHHKQLTFQHLLASQFFVFLDQFYFLL
jgi:hypothetical protein